MRPSDPPDLTDSAEADLELVQAALRRDPAALEQLVTRMRCIPRILAAKLRRMAGAALDADVDDLAQETFVLVWSKLAEFEGRGCLEAWAYRFCCNVLMNAQQRLRRRPEPLGVELPEIESAHDSEALPAAERDLLLDALYALDPAEGRVIELKHLDGLTFDEIGRRLELSPNSAKTRYYRGLATMRRALARHFREAPHG